MAGVQEDVLDMSLFDFQSQEDLVVEDTTQELQDDNSSVEITDGENQDRVGEEGEEKALEEDKGNDPNSPANSEDVFKPLALFLKEQGFFSNLDKEIKNEDDLAEAFQSELKKNEYADLNDSQKEYLDALREGIPDELVKEHIKTRSIFESITDDILENDEDVRKQVIVQERVAKGMSQERAEREYRRISDLGQSYEEAKESRESLGQMEQQEYQRQIEQEKINKVEQEKEVSKQLEELKKAVYGEEKLFGVFKVDDGLRNKVYKSMNEIVDFGPKGEPLNKLLKHRIEDPIGFENKLYYLYELTNGFNDITKFVNKSTTTAAKQLRNAISNSTFIKSNGEGANITDETDDNTYSSPIVSLDI